MKIKTIWNERFGMLMASGSPGSALAYQLGRTGPEPYMMRRNMATVRSPSSAETAEAPARSFGARVQRAFDRFGGWNDEKAQIMDPRDTPNLTDIEVIPPPAARAFEFTPVISLAAIERAQREAHRLRAQYMQEMFSAAVAWVWSLGRRLLVSARPRA